ncbi:hypothetical protein VTO42DRAFT_7919 [Malbranchea cinnamomea]
MCASRWDDDFRSLSAYECRRCIWFFDRFVLEKCCELTFSKIIAGLVLERELSATKQQSQNPNWLRGDIRWGLPQFLRLRKAFMIFCSDQAAWSTTAAPYALNPASIDIVGGERHARNHAPYNISLA